MIVYRVECPNCFLGPYTCCCTVMESRRQLNAMADRHNQNANDGVSHPGISTDLPQSIRIEEHVCGFDSLHKLKVWFHGYRTLLRSLNFKVGVYKVCKVYKTKSGTQLAFKRNTVVSYQRIP